MQLMFLYPLVQQIFTELTPHAGHWRFRSGQDRQGPFCQEGYITVKFLETCALCRMITLCRAIGPG